VTLDSAIERPSLRGEAVRRIRAAIVYGEIGPEEIHSAPALAERMGVSITPVREALLELTHRGLVEQVRNRGFRVVAHTRADLDAALELRELVEVPMLARLAGRLDAEDAKHLRGIVKAGAGAARKGDASAFGDLDRTFHLGLLARAGNPRIVELVDELLDQFRLAGAAADLVAEAKGHAAILDAIVAGDPDAVTRAAGEHIALTRAASSP
jgi:DNA-binding GntR family transcriptional regulator